MNLAKIRSTVRHAWYGAQVSSLARSLRKDRLTYLTYARLRTIERCTSQVTNDSIPGDFLEAGVALGGTTILLARRALADRAQVRAFHGYDVFGQIPPPTSTDDEKAHHRYEVIRTGAAVGIQGKGTYYGYEPNLYDRVVSNLRRHGVRVDGQRVCLNPGLFEDTLKPAPDQRIAFAHIDCDWHDPVALCLDRLFPHLAVGGYFVIDDYNDYQGCRRAVDAFLAKTPSVHVLTRSDNLVLRRES